MKKIAQLEKDYDKLDQEAKDKAKLFTISQITLVILGSLIGFTITVIVSTSISISYTKIGLLVLMMFICVAIYSKAIGAVNNNWKTKSL